MPASVANETFGRYTLVERIAHGGMAEVFRAVSLGAAGVEKQVALKRVLPVLGDLPAFVTMFIDEAHIAASLNHVNIAQVYEFGEVEGVYYLAMELIEGSDLGRLAEAGRKLGKSVPPEMAAFIIAEAARGLGYAHEKTNSDGAPLGIVHRDVSPQNVLVSYAGEVKVTDFGIAKAAGKVHKTESGAVMGKLRYMSPEQVLGEPLDGRSDIFSLGSVMFELLVGRALFDGQHPGRVADQVKNAAVPPQESVPEIPPELYAICMRALAPKRDDRYARAADFARELTLFVAQRAPHLGRDEVGALVTTWVPRGPRIPVELAATHPKDTRPAAKKQPQSSTVVGTRRRWRGWRWLGFVAVAGGGTATWLALRTPEPTVIVVPQPLATTQDLSIPHDAGPADAAPATPTGDSPERAALRARLQAAIDVTPRRDVLKRGTAASDYLATLSAVDSTLCAPGPEPSFSPDSAERVKELRFDGEATALGRYVVAFGGLPDAEAAALRSFLRSRPAFSPGANGWTFAGLASTVEPDEARHLVDLLRQNTSLRRWPEVPPAGPRGHLCSQAAVVGRLERIDAQRAAPLLRYLKARNAETPIDANGLRWQVLGAARDEGAATVEIRLRVSNLGAAPAELGAIHIAGQTGPLAAATDGGHVATIPAGASIDMTLNAGVGDREAEAVTLAVPGVELQAYSELLR
jgi:hypothetical protein